MLQNLNLHIITACIFFHILLVAETETYGQDITPPNQTSNTSVDFSFKPIVAIETWATYSFNIEKQGKKIENQTDLHIRRMRFGGKGHLGQQFTYNFQVHYDRLGENSLSATRGASKDNVQVWNAFISAKLLKGSEILNLHAGYFWAATSRESNTSPWGQSSFDKSYSSMYLRNFSTGKNNGIETGIGIGGLKNFDNNFGISYRASAHKPKAHLSPNYNTLLYSGRLMLTIGDPEQRKYKYMLSGDAWKNRKGVTLGFGASSQGKTDNQLSGPDSVFFDKSTTFGGDILLDYLGFRFDSEYFIMKRAANNYHDFRASEWHIKASYNIKANNQFIEPMFMIAKYCSDSPPDLYTKIGYDITYDLGINWYINKSNIKLSLHYVAYKGDILAHHGDFIGSAFQIKL